MNQPSAPPPGASVFQIASSAVAVQALWTAAELGVADHVTTAPTPVSDLAAKVGAHPDALYRVMRFLAMVGIFRETGDRSFVQTPMSETLRSDHPGHMRAAVRMLSSPSFWLALGQFKHAVQTGETAWVKAHGKLIFDYFPDHPEEGALFNDAMIGIHGAEPPAVAEAYDFGGLETVVDVGGGSGNMMINILQRHPGPRGIVFDLPPAAEAARERIEAAGLSSRCAAVAGDFFERVPEGADAYVLSHIIHDWDEARCVSILERCRRAMKPGGRVLIVEMVVPGPNEPHPAKLLDLVMLTFPGGRERTGEEYAALLAKAGLRLERIVPTASPVSVVEAFAA